MSAAAKFPKHTPAWQRERATALHRFFAEAAERTAAGDSLHSVFRKFAKKPRPPRRAGRRRMRVSVPLLYRLYRVWEKNPTPLALLLGYRPGKRCPERLVHEFIQRCMRPKAGSVAAVYRSLVSDWHAAKPVPGIGTWRTWVREHCAEPQISAPAFPFAARTFARKFTQSDLRVLQKLRRERAAAIARLDRAEAEFRAKALARGLLNPEGAAA